MECCRQDTEEAMAFIDIKYGLIQFTNLYQMNHYFSYLSIKTSYLTGNIVMWKPVLHTSTRDTVSSFYVRIEIKLTQNSLALKRTRKLVHFYSQLVPICTSISSITIYSISPLKEMSFKDVGSCH